MKPAAVPVIRLEAVDKTYARGKVPVRALGPRPELGLQDLGALGLRGRKEAIRAWGVELNRP